MNVVGTMFFKDKKLLIDKPRKRPTYFSNTLKNEVVPYCLKNGLIK